MADRAWVRPLAARDDKAAWALYRSDGHMVLLMDEEAWQSSEFRQVIRADYLRATPPPFSLDNSTSFYDFPTPPPPTTLQPSNLALAPTFLTSEPSPHLRSLENFTAAKSCPDLRSRYGSNASQPFSPSSSSSSTMPPPLPPIPLQFLPSTPRKSRLGTSGGKLFGNDGAAELTPTPTRSARGKVLVCKALSMTTPPVPPRLGVRKSSRPSLGKKTKAIHDEGEGQKMAEQQDM